MNYKFVLASIVFVVSSNTLFAPVAAVQPSTTVKLTIPDSSVRCGCLSVSPEYFAYMAAFEEKQKQEKLAKERAQTMSTAAGS